MKMKWTVNLFLVAAVLIGSVPESEGAGFGFYGNLGHGRVYLEDNNNRESGDFFGGGMVLDTAVALKRFFNYRLNVGYERVNHDTGKLESLVIDQDFGFALHQTERSRLWMGPELRIAMGSGDSSGLGIAPVIGLNLHTGQSVSTSLKLGYMFRDFSDGWLSDSRYEKENHVFLNVAVLFRSEWDQYYPSRPRSR